MTWQTRTAFVSSEERIERIEKIKIKKGIQTSGAIARYMSKHDFPPLAGLTEGGFAIDFYPIRDDIKRKMIIGSVGNGVESEIDRSERSGDGNSSFKEIDGVIASGTSSSPKDAVANLKDKDIFIFWYNGNWSIIKVPNEHKIGYIPVGLATKVIQSTDILISPYSPSEILNKLQKEKLPSTDYESVVSEKMAELMGMSHLYSRWTFDGIVNIMLNTHMKDGPYFLRRNNEKIYVTFHIGFSHDLDSKPDIMPLFNETNKVTAYGQYSGKIAKGFKGWDNDGKSFAEENGAEFGYKNVYVDVKIVEYTKLKKANVKLFCTTDKTSNTYEISNVRPVPGYSTTWKINNIGEMTMYSFYKAGKDEILLYSIDDYVRVAKHEFGHFLGIGDAYLEDDNGTPLTPVNAEVPFDDVMRGGNKVTSNDIEMMFLAALKNQKQDFTDQNGFMSEAIITRK